MKPGGQMIHAVTEPTNKGRKFWTPLESRIWEKKNVMCTVIVTSLYDVALSNDVAFSNLKKKEKFEEEEAA